MHELSLVEDILRIAGKQAGGRTVKRVVLEVGALTCVMPEALEFCFDSCKAAAALEQAQLVIERHAGVARCEQCGSEFELDELYQPCACGSFDKAILQGQELRILSLELE
ncbi:MAG: hydrogenase maturation nickel metallochaperone HypA [Pseudomonadota bacterium]